MQHAVLQVSERVDTSNCDAACGAHCSIRCCIAAYAAELQHTVLQGNRMHRLCYIDVASGVKWHLCQQLKNGLMAPPCWQQHHSHTEYERGYLFPPWSHNMIRSRAERVFKINMSLMVTLMVMGRNGRRKEEGKSQKRKNVIQRRLKKSLQSVRRSEILAGLQMQMVTL